MRQWYSMWKSLRSVIYIIAPPILEVAIQQLQAVELPEGVLTIIIYAAVVGLKMLRDAMTHPIPPANAREA